MLTIKRIEYIINDNSIDIEHKILLLLDYANQSNKEDLIMYLIKELYLVSKDKDIMNNYIKTLSDKIGVLESENKELSAYILELKDKKKKGKKKRGFKDYDYQA